MAAAWERCRRPLTAEERRHTVAMGTALRRARQGQGATQLIVALAAQLSVRHLGALERGERRPRRSTLQRLAEVLAGEDEAPVLLGRLLELVGPACAPESVHADRVDRRRLARTVRKWTTPLVEEWTDFLQLEGFVVERRYRRVRIDDYRFRVSHRDIEHVRAVVCPLGVVLAGGTVIPLGPTIDEMLADLA